ncbi:tyrosine-type recombinase/integrase [Halapricum desulfuricans]|uniref:XerD/XerC family integrase n=1 Tax=Halapricum desulfuricans TaxID=2841257 RepID=A0A897NWF6_9EURY|nr:tyrosine-type recombinase/integrase [Halapricum desulfuricans]QSG14456.1 XerD/XerC family integrase [Halapricum desulfuricans]
MTRSIEPKYARELFLESKHGEIKQSSVRAYRYPTKHFIEFLDEADIDSMADVDGFHLEQWRLRRKREDISDATLKTNCKHIRHFLNWCEDKEIAQDGLAGKLTIPNVAESKMVSSEKLPLAQAEEMLEHLDTYEYATLYHTLFEVMWETACRISGAMAFDVEDFVHNPEPTAENPDPNPYLKFRDRPEQGTALKNGKKSERNVTISERSAKILVKYLSHHHKDLADEYGRTPLFCTDYKRLSRQRAYKAINRYTRPCIYSGNCPHGRKIDACEAYVNNKKAMQCPSSKSLHPIRRGSITHHLKRGWPKEALAERVDVSVEVLEKHYDARTHEDKREGRRRYVELL